MGESDSDSSVCWWPVLFMLGVSMCVSGLVGDGVGCGAGTAHATGVVMCADVLCVLCLCGVCVVAVLCVVHID